MTRKISIALLAALCAAPLAAQEAATSKYKVGFYGHVKTDVVYDVHGVSGDDYMKYVVSGKDSERDFRTSARGTRFGLDITDGDKVSAKIETDFLGLSESVGGAAGATTDLRLRHAYVSLKAGKFDILAGQTWHLTPLELPGTSNDFALGNSGALWMRAPQLRVTYKRSDKLSFAAAVVRPTTKLTDSEGTASGLPQGQVQAQYKLGKAKLTLMGALGQWRKSTGEKGEVSLVDLGFNVPLHSIVTLNGQLWTGRNLSDFLGGIGQNQYGTSAVKASGGFANLAFKPAGRWSFNAAYGVDNPVDTRLAPSAAPSATASRTRNATALVNTTCQVYDKVGVTLEAAKQMTEYKLAAGKKELRNLHYQLSFKFPF